MTWPRAGSALHHSVGVWSFLIDDSARSSAWSPPHRMELRACAWPVGEASVVIDVKETGEGTCLVRIREEARRGPACAIPRPLLAPVIRWRNAETLHRLAYLAEGMAARSGEQTTADEEERG